MFAACDLFWCDNFWNIRKKLIITFRDRAAARRPATEVRQFHVENRGLEAIEAFSLSHESSTPEPYDLICMDINMPKMDGLRATKLIREIERGKGVEGTECESAIIITSAVDDPTTIIKACYEYGANYYFTKPLDFKQMTRQMQKLSLII